MFAAKEAALDGKGAARGAVLLGAEAASQVGLHVGRRGVGIGPSHSDSLDTVGVHRMMSAAQAVVVAGVILALAAVAFLAPPGSSRRKCDAKRGVDKKGSLRLVGFEAGKASVERGEAEGVAQVEEAAGSLVAIGNVVEGERISSRYKPRQAIQPMRLSISSACFSSPV